MEEVEEQERLPAVAHVERHELRRQHLVDTAAKGAGLDLEEERQRELVAEHDRAGFREAEPHARPQRAADAAGDELQRRACRKAHRRHAQAADSVVEAELDARAGVGHAAGRGLGRRELRGCVPEQDARVGAARDERARVRREGERGDGTAVAGERRQAPELGHFGPLDTLQQLDRVLAVPRARNVAPVRRDRALPRAAGPPQVLEATLRVAAEPPERAVESEVVSSGERQRK